MKNMTKLAFVILAGLCLTWACRKIEVGYLSDHINYGNPLVYVTKGSAFVTPALMPDGSTRPLTVEMTEIRHKASGEIATDLMQVRPLTVWKERYDYETDHTMADVVAKLEVKDMPAFELNTTSGQVRFNENTRYATGTQYEYDLRISNVRGTKDYIGLGQVMMADVPPVNWRTPARIQIAAMNPHQVIFSQFENIANHLDGTSTMVIVEKISDTPMFDSTTGISVKVRAADKNGALFSAIDEMKEGWPGYDLYGYGVASVDTELTADGFIYHFPTLPFPFFNKASQSYTYWHIVDSAIGVVDHPSYDPARDHWLNFRLNLDILEPGTWQITIHYPMVTRS